MFVELFRRASDSFPIVRTLPQHDNLVGCFPISLHCSGSSDYSVRVWRLSGEYLQTLGSFVPWSLDVTRFPPDVRKVASFTTFKVLINYCVFYSICSSYCSSS